MRSKSTCLRTVLLVAAAAIVMVACAAAQEDRKTHDDKPADPDTCESTIEETTLGVLPDPFTDRGVKFAATYIGEAIGNPSGGSKQRAIYEGRLNLAVDADLEKLLGLPRTSSTPKSSGYMEMGFHAAMCRIS
jgi:porin